MTEDRALAADWFARFEGAGLDGVIAKRLDGAYEPGKRGWAKVKHARTADVAIAGFRWHKDEVGTGVGSLILGLHDDAGTLHHVGVASGFAAARRRELVDELAALRPGALDDHPWREWATARSWRRRRPAAGCRARRAAGTGARTSPGSRSAWSASPRLPTITCRATASDTPRRLVRWRPDRRPDDCRYDQLETTAPYELADIFGGESR